MELARNRGSERGNKGANDPAAFLSFLCCSLVSHFSFLFSLCLILVSCSPAASLAGDSTSTLSGPGASQSGADSGIYGAMVAAWGNAPSNPPTYECVKIFDSSGERLIATGVCSGTFAQFRIPLPPGRYLVDRSLIKTPPGAQPKAQPGSQSVAVAPGQWVNLSPKAPPRPIP